VHDQEANSAVAVFHQIKHSAGARDFDIRRSSCRVPSSIVVHPQLEHIICSLVRFAAHSSERSTLEQRLSERSLSISLSISASASLFPDCLSRNSRH